MCENWAFSFSQGINGLIRFTGLSKIRIPTIRIYFCVTKLCHLACTVIVRSVWNDNLNQSEDCLIEIVSNLLSDGLQLSLRFDCLTDCLQPSLRLSPIFSPIVFNCFSDHPIVTPLVCLLVWLSPNVSLNVFDWLRLSIHMGQHCRQLYWHYSCLVI